MPDRRGWLHEPGIAVAGDRLDHAGVLEFSPLQRAMKSVSELSPAGLSTGNGSRLIQPGYC